MRTWLYDFTFRGHPPEAKEQAGWSATYVSEVKDGFGQIVRSEKQYNAVRLAMEGKKLPQVIEEINLQVMKDCEQLRDTINILEKEKEAADKNARQIAAEANTLIHKATAEINRLNKALADEKSKVDTTAPLLQQLQLDVAELKKIKQSKGT